ncbi:DEAD-box ATP-dependent RNA helicase 20 [Forsythia ovata]|uniref:DEAD-box ATP-dependent RNA helicase 20 n=1 Tax=Forsythia ovata TaxID=205694 RepID=A0ABD1T8Z9_9LAMI
MSSGSKGFISQIETYINFGFQNTIKLVTQQSRIFDSICMKQELTSDSEFGGGSSYCSSSSLSIKRDYEGASEAPQRKLNLDGLTPFEKNFYVESPSMTEMSESEVEEYRRRREITVEGNDVPKLVKAFQDVGFPEAEPGYDKGVGRRKRNHMGVRGDAGFLRFANVIKNRMMRFANVIKGGFGIVDNGLLNGRAAPQASDALVLGHLRNSVHHALVVVTLCQRESAVGLHPNHCDISWVPHGGSDATGYESCRDLTRQRHIFGVGICPFLLQNVVQSHSGGGVEGLAIRPCSSSRITPDTMPSTLSSSRHQHYLVHPHCCDHV